MVFKIHLPFHFNFHFMCHSPNRISKLQRVGVTCARFESTMGTPLLLDDVHGKDTTASLKRFPSVVGLRRISELAAVFALISWSAGMKASGACFVDFSDHLLNHHVVFLIGNAIIVSLLVLCRQSDAAVSEGCFYEECVKYSEAAVRQPEPALHSPSTGGGEAAHKREPGTITEESFGGSSDDGEKQIVLRADEAEPISQCDDAAAAIEKAKRQIRRFQRTQSEKLKREISVRAFRRSETDDHRKTATEMETLSNEEFRRKVEAFIDAHWSGRNGTKNMSFQNYPLLKMA